MFDPFHDFETEGYLRNVRKDKDARNIKRFEHDLFEAHIETAFAHLAAKKVLTYEDFLSVHRILFADYYPWAGQDRGMVLPHSAVKKGSVLFAHPQSARLAVEHGLKLGQNTAFMAQKPGEVMGLFAYGHPFLDGNGRTMLLVHIELCHRAGFSIAWHKTNKSDYLTALSQEIETPSKGILDAYLLAYKEQKVPRSEWGMSTIALKGLDGLGEINQIEGQFSDPAITEKYRKLEEKRGYSYTTPVLSSLS